MRRTFASVYRRPSPTRFFRSAVVVTPGSLWHYAGAELTCRFRYRVTRARITVHQSESTCRWLGRVATGWHREHQTPTRGLQARVNGFGA
jgi:hypothetical protein